MRRVVFILILLFCVIAVASHLQDQKPAPGHYLFVWCGDAGRKGNDFLAVVDADLSSPSYGHLLTSLATDQQTMRVHHTEYTMPASGMLFANDHDAGRTFIFDLRDPLHPKLVTSFTDMAGYIASSLLLAAAEWACAGHLPARAPRRQHRTNGQDWRPRGNR